MSDASDWPKAVASVAMMGGFLFVLTIFFPLPWVLLTYWLEERAKTKRILAQARLQERRSKSPRHRRKAVKARSVRLPDRDAITHDTPLHLETEDDRG